MGGGGMHLQLQHNQKTMEVQGSYFFPACVNSRSVFLHFLDSWMCISVTKTYTVVESYFTFQG